VELYRKWAGYAAGPTEAGVTLIYGSMYGNTEKAMDVVARGIAGCGLPLNIFDAARTHVSYILPSLWTHSGVMIGAPTYEGALFPPVLDVLNHAAIKRIMNKKAAMFGSYGWSGGAVRNAFREVRQALSAQSRARESFDAQATRVEALQDTLRLARLRYASGIASQLDVLDAERGLLAAQTARIEALRAQRAAVADLYRALGG